MAPGNADAIARAMNLVAFANGFTCGRTDYTGENHSARCVPGILTQFGLFVLQRIRQPVTSHEVASTNVGECYLIRV